MSNTTQRILSAVFLVVLMVVSFLLGKWTMLAVVLAAGILCIDELLVNFAKKSRSEFIYRYVVIFFCIMFTAVNTAGSVFTLEVFTSVALVFNVFLIYYLFRVKPEEKLMKKVSEKSPGLLASLIIFPLFSFGIHFKFENWKEILAMLLIVTYSMDTGAWFVGKNFGKHKLWPQVSPNKTIEGLIGGMVFSAVIGSLAWWGFTGVYKVEYSVIFAICGGLSQIGDLIQSKLKREFQIKDSSNLIPGHGGVYDRIDSLIFLSPFFVIVVKYLKI